MLPRRAPYGSAIGSWRRVSVDPELAERPVRIAEEEATDDRLVDAVRHAPDVEVLRPREVEDADARGRPRVPHGVHRRHLAVGEGVAPERDIRSRRATTARSSLKTTRRRERGARRRRRTGRAGEARASSSRRSGSRRGPSPSGWQASRPASGTPLRGDATPIRSGFAETSSSAAAEIATGITISAVAVLLISWPSTRVRRTSPSRSACGPASPTPSTSASASCSAAPVSTIAVDRGIIPATRITVLVQAIPRYA